MSLGFDCYFVCLCHLQNEDEAAKMEVKEEKAKEIEKSTIKAKSKMTKVRTWQ